MKRERRRLGGSFRRRGRQLFNAYMILNLLMNKRKSKCSSHSDYFFIDSEHENYKMVQDCCNINFVFRYHKIRLYKDCKIINIKQKINHNSKLTKQTSFIKKIVFS